MNDEKTSAGATLAGSSAASATVVAPAANSTPVAGAAAAPTAGRIFDLAILRRLYTFVKPYQTRFYGLIAIILLSACLAPLSPLLIRYTIDNVIAMGDYNRLTIMLVLLMSVLVVQAIVQFSNTYLSGWLGQYVIHDVRVQLYQKILQLRLKFFDNTPIGRLVTRSISDVETLADVFSEGMAAIAGDMLQLILIIGVMFYTDWRLAAISLSTIPLMLFSTYVFKEKIKKSFNEVRTAVANLNSFVQEHITGMNIVQIFGSEKIEADKFRDINTQHRAANIRSILYYSIYYPRCRYYFGGGGRDGCLVRCHADYQLRCHVRDGNGFCDVHQPLLPPHPDAGRPLQYPTNGYCEYRPDHDAFGQRRFYAQ